MWTDRQLSCARLWGALRALAILMLASAESAGAAIAGQHATARQSADEHQDQEGRERHP
jgi:hypothetical protein